MAARPPYRPMLPSAAPRYVRPATVGPRRVPALHDTSFKRPLSGSTQPPAAKRRQVDTSQNPQSPSIMTGARPASCFRPASRPVFRPSGRPESRPVVRPVFGFAGARPSAPVATAARPPAPAFPGRPGAYRPPYRPPQPGNPGKGQPVKQPAGKGHPGKGQPGKQPPPQSRHPGKQPAGRPALAKAVQMQTKLEKLGRLAIPKAVQRVQKQSKPDAAFIETFLGEDDFEEAEKDLTPFEEELPDDALDQDAEDAFEEDLDDNTLQQDELHDGEPFTPVEEEEEANHVQEEEEEEFDVELARTLAKPKAHAKVRAERTETVIVPDQIVETVILDLSATDLKVPFEIKQSIFDNEPSTITFGPACSPELDDVVAEVKEHMEELMSSLPEPPEPTAGAPHDPEVNAAAPAEANDRMSKLWKKAEADFDNEAADADAECEAAAVAFLESSNWEDDQEFENLTLETMAAEAAAEPVAAEAPAEQETPKQTATLPTAKAAPEQKIEVSSDAQKASEQGVILPTPKAAPEPNVVSPAVKSEPEPQAAQEPNVVAPAVKSAVEPKFKPPKWVTAAPGRATKSLEASQAMQMPLTPPRKPPEKGRGKNGSALTEQKPADSTETSTKADAKPEAQSPEKANGTVAAQASADGLAGSGATPAPKVEPSPQAHSRSPDDDANTADVARTGDGKTGVPDAVLEAAASKAGLPADAADEASARPAIEAAPAAAAAVLPASNTAAEPPSAVPEGGVAKSEAAPAQAKHDPGSRGAPSTPEPAQPPGKKTVQDWMNDQSMFAHLPALPKGWIRVMSSSNSIYYVNIETGEQTFVQPKEALPPNWKQVTSKSSGKTYYFHTVTGKCQFDKPVM